MILNSRINKLDDITNFISTNGDYVLKILEVSLAKFFNHNINFTNYNYKFNYN